MLVSMNDILPRAKAEHWAVGLFNTVNLEMAKGVIEAAEEMRAPVIIGTAEILTPFASLEDLSSFLIPLARKATVPIVLHLDHGLTLDMVKKAIRLGFTSVMYDCSTDDYYSNMGKVRAVVRYAHERGISVEGELGHVGANAASAEHAGTDDNSIYTDPKQALEYATVTGVDALAVAIGTAHGAYKAKPKLDFDRLKVISSMVKTPLVLHGGSGLSDDDFKRTIANGISKVNIFTDINTAFADAANKMYKPGMGQTDIMPVVREAVKQATMTKMELFGCAGRY
ncbi:MAG: class II fructose-bisphosphate aldolase [Clostridia bacterium]|nr:class II fructose-bisphosphate aldolase [Clostridia bacterium]